MQGKISNLLKFAIDSSKLSAKLLLQMQDKAKTVIKKKAGDFALDADYKSEELLVERIRKRYPEHDILTEETGSYENSSSYTWVIDPLEGTLNYAHKLPLWGVNIGLLYLGEPIIGVCYFPALNELFYGAKGMGAYLNNKKIKVSPETDITKSLFAASPKHIPLIDLSHYLLRAPGCASLSLCYVACGRFGGVAKVRGSDPYGYVAPSIIVLEAGGKITDIKGKPWNYKSEGAVFTNGKLHTDFMAKIKK